MSWTITPQQKVKGLLDEFTGAAAAYSLRNLSVLQNPYIVRVRRSSDNAEQDFTAIQISDGTLTTFCGAGNGFVRTWYDQSGNNRHLNQSLAANQPQIVSSGSLVMRNSKPAISHSASSRWLFVDTSYSTDSHTLFKVCTVTGGGHYSRILTVASEQLVLRKEGSNYNIYGAGLIYTATPTQFPTSQRLLSLVALHSLGDAFAYQNGSLFYSNTAGAGATATVSSLYIGGVADGLEGFIGDVQEVVLYPTNQTSSRAAIESNINAHYAIY